MVEGGSSEIGEDAASQLSLRRIRPTVERAAPKSSAVVPPSGTDCGGLPHFPDVRHPDRCRTRTWRRHCGVRVTSVTSTTNVAVWLRTGCEPFPHGGIRIRIKAITIWRPNYEIRRLTSRQERPM